MCPQRTAELENFSISDNLIELNIDMDTRILARPSGQYIRVENNGNVRSTYIVNLSTVNAGDVKFNFCQLLLLRRPSSERSSSHRVRRMTSASMPSPSPGPQPMAQHRLGVPVSTTTGITPK